MSEQLNSYRIKFISGKQRSFLEQCQSTLSLDNYRLSELLNISVRTLTDWKREKFYMTASAAEKLTRMCGIKLPKGTKQINKYWYTSNAGKIGGLAMYKKYKIVGGNQNHRLRKWHKWWETKGQFQPSHILNKPLSFNKPNKSEELAEFVGIIIGDGGISKYQITITLHHKDDLEYIGFVIKLIQKLFGITPSVYHNKNNSVKNIVISRVKLVDFFTQSIGLKIGNKIKQRIDIPEWIKRNIKYQRACMRGLMDTDGSLVIHKYKVNNKQYCYKKLNFCSASPPLVKSVMQILKKFDFKSRLSHNGRNIWIDDQKEVARYLQLIGSNNPKHLQRWGRIEA